MRQIHAGGSQHHQCTHGFDFGFHCGEGAQNIWVMHNRRAGFLFQRGSLHPVKCIGPGLLIRPVRNAQPLQANGKPGMVHHAKHDIKPLIFGTNKIANGTAIFTILHDRCWGRLNAKLLFNRQTA